MPAGTPGPPAARVTKDVIDAVRTVSGLRPATPVRRPAWLRWDPGTLAVDLENRAVEVRVVVTALPLPPRLDQAGAAIRAVLAGTRWAQAPLRLRVTDIDASAFAGPGGFSHDAPPTGDTPRSPAP
jgi:hypothetical protein